MGKALSLDLRKRIVEARLSGVSTEDAAQRFCVGEATVYRLMALWRKEVSLEPRIRSGRSPIIDDVACELIRDWLKQQNDLTLGEINSRLSDHGYHVTLQAVFYCLKRIGLSYKKNNARK